MRFVIAFGIVSLFADMTYEGMRSIAGPYLALLGASGTVVGLVAGIGELLGYTLRLASGRLADRFWAALLGTLLWGVGVGVHETVMSAAIAHMVPAYRRARAYGIFTAIFGVSWFAGSAALGALYDRSLMAAVVVAALTQLAGIVPIMMAAQMLKT